MGCASERKRCGSSGPAQRDLAKPRQDRKVAAVGGSSRVPQGYLAGAGAFRTPQDGGPKRGARPYFVPVENRPSFFGSVQDLRLFAVPGPHGSRLCLASPIPSFRRFVFRLPAQILYTLPVRAEFCFLRSCFKIRF